MAGAVVLWFGWMTWQSIRAPDMGGFVAVLGVCTAIFSVGFLVSLWWVKSQWRELRWEMAERAGRCPRCAHDVRAAGRDVCPACGLPVWQPRNPLTGAASSSTSR